MQRPRFLLRQETNRVIAKEGAAATRAIADEALKRGARQFDNQTRLFQEAVAEWDAQNQAANTASGAPGAAANPSAPPAPQTQSAQTQPPRPDRADFDLDATQLSTSIAEGQRVVDLAIQELSSALKNAYEGQYAAVERGTVGSGLSFDRPLGGNLVFGQGRFNSASQPDLFSQTGGSLNARGMTLSESSQAARYHPYRSSAARLAAMPASLRSHRGTIEGAGFFRNVGSFLGSTVLPIALNVGITKAMNRAF